MSNHHKPNRDVQMILEELFEVMIIRTQNDVRVRKLTYDMNGKLDALLARSPGGTVDEAAINQILAKIAASKAKLTEALTPPAS